MQQTNDNCVLVKFSQCVPTESQQMTQLDYFWRICGNVMCVFSQQMAVQPHVVSHCFSYPSLYLLSVLFLT